MENTAKFITVCGTQNRLRIRGKNLCVQGENAKMHKTEDISNLKIFLIKAKNHFTLLAL
jgi:hypothetical protein